ncbi:unnamed protein product, partial [Mesorhabditis spiculigera]
MNWVLLMGLLVAGAVAYTPLFDDYENPSLWRLGKRADDDYPVVQSKRGRELFGKRSAGGQAKRARELFGKRSSPDYDVPSGEMSAELLSRLASPLDRFRRARTSELFGR